MVITKWNNQRCHWFAQLRAKLAIRREGNLTYEEHIFGDGKYSILQKSEQQFIKKSQAPYPYCF
jgi:hypothetical protein